MEVVILPGPDEVARVAARRIAEAVRRRPDAVVGLATGSSPLGLYAELARQVAAGWLDVSGIRGFGLDEYVGLPPGHPQSYASVLRRTVVQPLGLDPARVHVPDGGAADLDAAAAGFERRIEAAGGIDVQILGIGANGHIGFNEPTSSLSSRTRVKTLAPRTRADNARFFGSPEDVPVHCLTQGLGTILEARELVLVAQGRAKADAVAAAVEGPLSSMCPASVLQLHPRAGVYLDEAAAARLRLADYYRHTWAHRPGGG
ncbi:glucosamine-6-phosphate deaminase [Blastococcus sp. MG754426]|uniref:glucosamine-6-phosphate deaminase n=1 Tax=unclassified Blastococcus TaxID=2619396 RepID=UPI001EF0B2BC|nr:MULTISPECIES: glucosamine-6-phosphate deaminase [unclassified Blastococcus]MCF6506828.1 glucosamine-6-phosphate deaminase [Blastococcus sp. MG754426]MCF6511628.1 glucosamine-6-phosphate deaminase [Blastococcus sp. MG754427]MCF6733722.1 glucosamine-6-phosphate deaminase [Blastococcus sp. KM273129]